MMSGSQKADVQVALARDLEAQGQTQQAREFYAQAGRNDPTRSDAWLRLAVLSDLEGLCAESEDAYHRTILLRPNDPDVLCNFGYSLYLQERWAEAEQALQRAIALRPDHQRAQNNLGLVLARTGRDAEALDCFRRAGCSNADSHLNLAYALTLNGDVERAGQEYRVALELDPESEAARSGLARLDALAPNLDRLPPLPHDPVLVPATGDMPESSLELLPVTTPPYSE